MLFERIHYMIETTMQRKQEDVSRSTNKQILDLRGELRYSELIGDIRKAFFSGLSRCKTGGVAHSGSGGSGGALSVQTP
jgi:hypothetical protein